jgi:hypothetical protein
MTQRMRLRASFSALDVVIDVYAMLTRIGTISMFCVQSK